MNLKVTTLIGHGNSTLKSVRNTENHSQWYEVWLKSQPNTRVCFEFDSYEKAEYHFFKQTGLREVGTWSEFQEELHAIN